MIGDIDILVSENDIHSADRILKNIGYYEISSEKTVFTKNISAMKISIYLEYAMIIT